MVELENRHYSISRRRSLAKQRQSCDSNPSVAPPMACCGSNTEYGKTGALARRLPRWREYDVAKFHRAVIALNHERTGRCFIAVERTARNSRDLLVFNECLAVQHDGHHATNEGNVVRLPVTRPTRSGFVGRQKTVDCAEVILRRLERVAILDLHLVPPA